MKRLKPPKVRAWVARNVRRQRGALGMTVDAAAGRAGVHARHWAKVEAETVYVTLNTLVRLSGALGVETADLLNEARVPVRARRKASKRETLDEAPTQDAAPEE